MNECFWTFESYSYILKKKLNYTYVGCKNVRDVENFKFVNL